MHSSSKNMKKQRSLRKPVASDLSDTDSSDSRLEDRSFHRHTSKSTPSDHASVRSRSGRSRQNGAILLFGVTGSGKSTFVSHLTADEVGIGHSLRSSTVEASMYAVKSGHDSKYIVIDTPGFNDSSKSDTDILKELAWILGKLYRLRIDVLGLIYLHPIIDTRVSGSTLRSFRIFEEICGERFFPFVTLVTTMWEALHQYDLESGAAREGELKERGEFWGHMIAHGATTAQHDGSESSAREIFTSALQKLAFERRKGAIPELQLELMKQRRTLIETKVGSVMLGDIADHKHHIKKELVEVEEGIKDAEDDKEEVVLSSLKEQRSDLQRILQSSVSSEKELMFTYYDLDKERRVRSETLQRDTKQQRVDILALKKTIENMDLENMRIREEYSRELQQTEERKAEWALKHKNLEQQIQAVDRAKANETILNDMAELQPGASRRARSKALRFAERRTSNAKPLETTEEQRHNSSSVPEAQSSSSENGHHGEMLATGGGRNSLYIRHESSSYTRREDPGGIVQERYVKKDIGGQLVSTSSLPRRNYRTRTVEPPRNYTSPPQRSQTVPITQSTSRDMNEKSTSKTLI